ncbi:alpha-D-ribose 1-methylphosphonate 5-phosphate C-P-lyase PhnJ [Streptomyces sp. TS71-3]|uniref:alpha-D-ribose 1-methylphosphonate 5-phosphate C-P-lyase PhnJ n=1 Tax=Streptomyces sp. TS71-3 TaxID=2733862 RepID=UPI001B08F8D2|nr:alpha-D-ribose 1-methylphosphonate 5-phosphate C-P-lyase PhnJ [Streptomyces sp. TS71-3]GHJ35618.1 carbon-phosphorus lyase complex subunit PhnJ [Streptomyces sp. TS71-3]
MSTTRNLDRLAGPEQRAGIFDELSKREIRRAILSGVAIPGYQVPFGSREMPVARGWGSGGLQATLALVGEGTRLKVIDQGEDAGVNASNLRRLVVDHVGCVPETDTRAADVIQSRHRIPEQPLAQGQVLVLQVPGPEPLAGIVKEMDEQRRMHAEADYAKMWVRLYEDIVHNGVITASAGYPVLVEGRYVMTPSPIPRWDVPKLHDSEGLTILAAGREKRIFAVPPHTRVEPLTFEDRPFEVEFTPGAACRMCGTARGYIVEEPGEGGAPPSWVCSDADFRQRCHAGELGPVLNTPAAGSTPAAPAPKETSAR